jgi:hypothetical protein
MDMISRSTTRAVLPPLLALGLVAIVTRPIDAAELRHPAAVAVMASAHQSSTGAGMGAVARVRAAAAAAQASGGQTVTVEVPAVSFTKSVVAIHGRLHVPVLLMDPTVTATATVESDPTCSVRLVQGRTGWVDCAVTAPTLLVVHLSDGRAYARVVEVA